LCAKEFSFPPNVTENLELFHEYALIDGLNEYYEAQSDGYSKSGYEQDSGGSTDEGTWIRTYGGDSDLLSDGTAKPYYPSASKGDRMATGEELQELFGINYVDERN
jgi:hypothetical protein